ncbi:hypothetical protein Acsp02_50840 [Actinoplanes sp. NBRC 103695]|nr:hypothetical protein Acsp02_50840 [Actinoplanes sp. NBRC 103695]
MKASSDGPRSEKPYLCLIWAIVSVTGGGRSSVPASCNGTAPLIASDIDADMEIARRIDLVAMAVPP